MAICPFPLPSRERRSLQAATLPLSPRQIRDNRLLVFVVAIGHRGDAYRRK